MNRGLNNRALLGDVQIFFFIPSLSLSESKSYEIQYEPSAISQAEVLFFYTILPTYGLGVLVQTRDLPP